MYQFTLIPWYVVASKNLGWLCVFEDGEIVNDLHWAPFVFD